MGRALFRVGYVVFEIFIGRSSRDVKFVSGCLDWR